MQRIDQILISIAILLLVGLLLYIDAMLILRIVIGLLIIGIVLYWKLFPYKTQLYPNYSKYMDIMGKVVDPALKLMDNLPNIQLGERFFLDSRYFVVCSLLLIILVVI